ncbi:MAG: hypothetical protein QHH14_13310 [Clostridiales bacterium]|nr:hypothetical protein [Clostridiales bacterium]
MTFAGRYQIFEELGKHGVGIILYEMLASQVPFEGDTPFTIGVKQKSEIRRDPRELNAQIPQDLSRLIFMLPWMLWHTSAPSAQPWLHPSRGNSPLAEVGPVS